MSTCFRCSARAFASAANGSIRKRASHSSQTHARRRGSVRRACVCFDAPARACGGSVRCTPQRGPGRVLVAAACALGRAEAPSRDRHERGAASLEPLPLVCSLTGGLLEARGARGRCARVRLVTKGFPAPAVCQPVCRARPALCAAICAGNCVAQWAVLVALCTKHADKQLHFKHLVARRDQGVRI